MATTTMAAPPPFGTTAASSSSRRGSAGGFPEPPPLERSDSLDVLLLEAPPSNHPNGRPSCASCGGRTADTAELSEESCSSLLSSSPEQVPPPSSSNHAATPVATAHTGSSKLASAAFFEGAFFSNRQERSSSMSLPDDLMMMSGGDKEEGHTRRRGGGTRRRKKRSSLLERAMALEVPDFPTELLLVNVDVVTNDERRRHSSSHRKVYQTEADETQPCQTREAEDEHIVDVTVPAASTEADPIRNQEDEGNNSRETSAAEETDPTLAAPPASFAASFAAAPPLGVVCQCCYDEIDPQSTMRTFTCSVSHLADTPNDDDDDDDELHALPPRPPLSALREGNHSRGSSNNNNNNHAVCAHCLASYVHEWVFGGTSYPLRKQERRIHEEDIPDPSTLASASSLAWAYELPCLSSDCPNGSYPRSVVQAVIASQAMAQYDEKLHRIYDGRKRSAVSAAALADAAPPERAVAEGPARPPSPPRSRGQLAAEETLTERRIRRCAVCCAAFVKESNTCNKIRCPHCNFRFCFVCLTDLPAKGYGHFCTHQYDAACDACVRDGITCHLWSHERDDESSSSSSGPDANAGDGDHRAEQRKDRQTRNANQQDLQPRKGLARHSAAAGTGKEKAERFLKKLLLPARKGHNKP